MTTGTARRHSRGRYRSDPDVAAAMRSAWRPTHAELVALWLDVAHAAGFRVHVDHDSRSEHFGADSGWPDVFAVGHDRAFAIEIKTDAYPTVTSEQIAWLGALGAVPGVFEGIWRSCGDRVRDAANIAEILGSRPAALPRVPRGAEEATDAR